MDRLLEMVKDSVIYGYFKLSSNMKSKYYYDLKKQYSRPEFLELAGEALAEKVRELNPDRIAALELGGIPLLAVVSLYSKKPMIMVRKGKRKHGTEKLLEGELSEGDDVLVLDDVTTTGSSIINTAEILREHKVRVDKALVIVDREATAEDNLRKHDIKLYCLYKDSETRTNQTFRI